jgi:hypothetical protein
LLEAAADADAAARLEPTSKLLRAERAAAVAAYEAATKHAPAPPPAALHITPLPAAAAPPAPKPAAPPPPAAAPPPPPPEARAAPATPPSPPKRAKGTITEVSGGKPLAEAGAAASPVPVAAQLRSPPPHAAAAAAPSSPAAAASPSTRRSVEELAAAAAAKLAVRPLEAPRSGIEFERAWGAVAGQPEQQLQLMKARARGGASMARAARGLQAGCMTRPAPTLPPAARSWWSLRGCPRC